MVGGPHASMLAKMYEEDHIGHPSSKILDPRIQMVNGKPTVKVPGHPRQQIHAENQQRVTDNRQRINVNKSIPLESTPHGVPKAMLPRTGPHDTVLKKRSCPLPLDGRPLTGIDQIPPGLGKQVLKSVPHMPIQQQCFQMLRAQSQQELVAQALQHTPQNLMSSFSGNFADMDPQTLMLLKVGLNRNDGPGTGNFGLQHIGSSPVEALSRMGKTAPTTESGRKKKGRSGCQAEDVTAAGYPAGSAESVLPIYVNMEREALSHSDRASEKQNIRGSNKSGLVEAFEKMGAMDGQDDASSDTYVESFLSYDNETEDMKNDPFSTLQRSSTTCGKNAPKGFSFEEVGCLSSSNSKVLCCHFSSDGKFLASAGHDKKVVIWNMDTFESKRSSEDHSLLITDVRFKPNSNLLATSSFDKTIQIWDASDTIHPIHKLTGHTEQVMSLDFHPEKVDLLCSCDGNNEILFWNVKCQTCKHISKGGTTQVRFQPQVGRLLAAAAGNMINILDVETDSLQFKLQGHVNEVYSICWDTSGKYIASVSKDCVCLWSTALGGECIHKLCSNGNKFQSCAFHPGYSMLLVVGGYKLLELWYSMESCKTMTVPAHDGLIAALANSPCNEMVASASHDQYVKLWK
nr:TPA_asm: hypothetical protein HUJ06_024307 [Nelumbo nucifera]